MRFRSSIGQLTRVSLATLAAFLLVGRLLVAGETARVIQVVDGDTIKVSVNGRIETSA